MDLMPLRRSGDAAIAPSRWPGRQYDFEKEKR